MSTPNSTRQEALNKEIQITSRVPSDRNDVVRGNEKRASSDDNPEVSDSSEVKEFKEGGYGWVVVASVLLVNAHTWGMNSAYAVFLGYYLHSNAFPGATAIDFAFVGGLSISMSLLISPIATTSIRVYGTRISLLIGVVFETIAFIGASFTTKVWHLILSQGIAFGIGMGFLFVGSVGVVPQWFTKKRSFANAIAASGTGFGGVCYSLGTNAMIKNIGLPWAFRILAILAFVVNGICSLLIKDRNKAVGAVHVAFRKELFTRIEYYFLLGWGFFSVLSYTIVIFSLSDYAQQVGFSASQGSIAAACFNISQAVGRPFIGLFSDRIGRLNMAAIGTGIAGIAALFLWTFAGKYYAGLIIYSLFGCTAGILWATVAPVAAEVVGLQVLPSALSIAWLVLVLPATFAEVIGLSLRKSGVNGYLDVQMFSGVLFIAAFACAWAMRVWKLHEMDTLGLTKEQREVDVRNPDAVMITREQSEGAASRKGKYSLASIWEATFTMQCV
ncbi:MFS general substrate transporter [Pleurostoma richardsiae]|uniref:MFS general substrate transporter n=1 Tax=Pleurostoma richardsiae TaxID=41990 RepID=A0AA38S6U5_9PEZI|nr:MFS general substrate transporter [Pleurostoma richardsiae]